MNYIENALDLINRTEKFALSATRSFYYLTKAIVYTLISINQALEEIAINTRESTCDCPPGYNCECPQTNLPR